MVTLKLQRAPACHEELFQQQEVKLAAAIEEACLQSACTGTTHQE